MTYHSLTANLVTSETLSVHGVPFRVTREAGRVVPIPYQLRIEVNAPVRALFFLGMDAGALR